MKTVGFIMMFGGVLVFAFNLFSLLLPTNPIYGASWIKVIVALCIVVAGAIVMNSLSLED